MEKIKIFDTGAKHQFCQEIMEYVIKEGGDNYLSAVEAIADKHEIDYSVIGKLIDKPLKQKIKQNAIELNYFKGNKNKLPFA